MVTRQFVGWSPANSRDGRPPILGLVARGMVWQVAGELLGVSPAGPRGGHPPILGAVAHQLAGWSPASSWDDHPRIGNAAACQSVSWSPANVQGVARQVLGWSGVVARQPLSAGRNPETAGGTTKKKTHAAVAARQLLGWSPANSEDGRPPIPGMVAHQFSGWSTPSRSLTQALHTYIDLTQACANKTPAPAHANCDAPLARHLTNRKRRIANTDVSHATALTDTNIAKQQFSDSVVCEKNARPDTSELRCPPPPPPRHQC